MKYILLTSLLLLQFKIHSQEPLLFRDFQNNINTVPSVSFLNVWKNELYFFGREFNGGSYNTNLWKTSGTNQSTQKLLGANIYGMVQSPNYLFLSCSIPQNSGQVKGVVTQNGTAYMEIPEITDLYYGFSKSDTLYINAEDQNNIRQLWRIVPATNSVTLMSGMAGGWLEQHIVLNNTIYFIAAFSSSRAMYKIVGNSVQLVASDVFRMLKMDETTVFLATYYGTAYNIQKLTLNPNNTFTWKYIPFTAPYFGYDMGAVQQMVKFKNKLFLVANLPQARSEIVYVEDGVIKDIKDRYTGTINNETKVLGEVNGNLIFQTNNQSGIRCIWKTDGTVSNTNIIANNLRSSLTFIPEPLDITPVVYENRLFFLGYTAQFGEEVWYTDGTSEGTKMLSDLNMGNENSRPSDFKVFDNKLFFVATHPSFGRELWYFESNCKSTNNVMGLADKNILALDFINSTQTVPSNINLMYKSKKAIVLNPGFNIQEGGVFKTDLNYGCQY